MGTRITSLTLSRNILSDVTLANTRLARTQQKLSSGKELTRPSDDPAAVGRALQLRTEMEGAQQYRRTVAEGIGWTDVTDSALSTITAALQRARELVVQGADDNSAGAGREAIAEELRGIIDSIKTAANASYGGRYVFGGTATDAAPFKAGADDAYYGDEERVGRQIGPGVAIDVNVHGREAIGDDDEGLLSVLRGVVAHLEADDGPALRNDLGLLSGSLDDLNAVRATVGATANRLEVAADRLSQYEGTTLQLLSETEDADFAKTMMDFTIQQNAMQAGLRAGASIVQNSLLDFLR